MEQILSGGFDTILALDAAHLWCETHEFEFTRDMREVVSKSLFGRCDLWPWVHDKGLAP